MWLIIGSMVLAAMGDIRQPTYVGDDGQAISSGHQRHGAVELRPESPGVELEKETISYRLLKDAQGEAQTEVRLAVQNRANRDQQLTLALRTQTQRLFRFYAKKHKVCFSKETAGTDHGDPLAALVGRRFAKVGEEESDSGTQCFWVSQPKQLEHKRTFTMFPPGDTSILQAVRLLSWPLFFLGKTQLSIVSVELTTNVIPIAASEYDSPGETYFELGAMVRFQVSLRLEAKKAHELRISYQQDNQTLQADLHDMFAWSFGLSAGAKLQAPVRQVVFSCPAQLLPKLPVSFALVGRIGDNSYYQANNISFAAEEDLRIEYEEFGDEPCVGEPQQDFVCQVKPSGPQPSGPADLAKLNRHCCPWNTPTEAEFKPSFEAQALFDGNRHTAWCVHGSDLNNAGVEFELKQDVLGVQIANGLLQSSKLCFKSFKRFGGARRLRFESKDGRVVQAAELVVSEDYQDFDQMSLPKGSYRLIVSERLPPDAPEICLGEIRFTKAAERRQLEEDPFFQDLLSR